MSIITSSIKLLKNSDLLSQSLVLLLLLGSFTTFIFFSYAFISLYHKINLIKKLLYNMQNTTVEQNKSNHNDQINKNYIYKITQSILHKNNSEELFFYMLSDYIYYENKIKLFFSLSIAIAPLLGLFGTIWGVINVFLNIKTNFNIEMIAPGIAEALITTLGGLIVAIPAVLFFHIISFYIKRYYEMNHLYYLSCIEKQNHE